MEVSLSPLVIFHLGPFAITNSIFTGWLLTLLLLLFALIFRTRLRPIPGRFQAAVEFIYSWLLDNAETIIGNEKVARELFPYLVTLFFYLVLSNWSGLFPGVGPFGIKEGDKIIPLLRAPSTDLNMVGVFALFSVGYVQYLGMKYTGVGGYIKKFLNFKSPIDLFVGILELIGEFTRIISYSFRLFGNILAGEVLIEVMLFLTITLLPYVPIIPIPFFFLELFVGVIQAFIFCFLTMAFVSLAIMSHDGHTETEAHSPEKLIHQPSVT